MPLATGQTAAKKKKKGVALKSYSMPLAKKPDGDERKITAMPLYISITNIARRHLIFDKRHHQD